jgi:hypothetical protein
MAELQDETAPGLYRSREYKPRAKRDKFQAWTVEPEKRSGTVRPEPRVCVWPKVKEVKACAVPYHYTTRVE